MWYLKPFARFERISVNILRNPMTFGSGPGAAAGATAPGSAGEPFGGGASSELMMSTPPLIGKPGRFIVCVHGLPGGAGGGTARLASLTCQATIRFQLLNIAGTGSQSVPSAFGKRPRALYMWYVSHSMCT